MLKQINIASNIKTVLEEKIPKGIIRERQIGKTTLSYVSGAYIIDQLNKAFDYAWDWTINEHWIQDSIPKSVKDYNTGKTTVQDQPPVCHVIGTLTVYFQTEEGKIISISKMAAGSKTVIGGASEQESSLKSASTDALKKAASLFGIAAQLYRSSEEQKHFLKDQQQQPQEEETLWTEEVKQQLQSDFEYLEYCKNAYAMSDKELDDTVNDWSQGKLSGLGVMTPDEFKQFITFLRQQEVTNNNGNSSDV